MNIRSTIEQLIHLKHPGIAIRMLLLPLALCSSVYGAVMRLRAWLYKACIFESHGLPCRVIAIGNITVGGTGKTPTVCLLARLLAGRGFKVCVVSRGYRGSDTHKPQIVSDGAQVLATAAQVGDEAVMLGSKLPGIPVIACRDRVAAGSLACERFGAQAVVLDDGFQHLRLRRDLDIVLLNAADPFGNGHLLPRGILREPLTALERAGIIVFTKAASPEDIAAPLARVKKVRAAAPVFSSSYNIAGFRNSRTGSLIAAERLAACPVAALCSIGDPESFLKMLARTSLTVAETLIYPDHHGYGAADYTAIRLVAQRTSFLVTTEKDIAKLDSGMLQISNLIVMEIEQVIEPAEKFLEEVLSRSGLRRSAQED